MSGSVWLKKPDPPVHVWNGGYEFFISIWWYSYASTLYIYMHIYDFWRKLPIWYFHMFPSKYTTFPVQLLPVCSWVLDRLPANLRTAGTVHASERTLSAFRGSPCQILCICIWVFPKIGVFTPKWMVFFMENPINPWMIWGNHYFRKHPCIYILYVNTFFLYIYCSLCNQSKTKRHDQDSVRTFLYKALRK